MKLFPIIILVIVFIWLFFLFIHVWNIAQDMVEQTFNKLSLYFLCFWLFNAFQYVYVCVCIRLNLWVLFVHWIDKSLFRFKIYVCSFSHIFKWATLNPLLCNKTQVLVILSFFSLFSYTTTRKKNLLKTLLKLC